MCGQSLLDKRQLAEIRGRVDEIQEVHLKTLAEERNELVHFNEQLRKRVERLEEERGPN